VHQVGDKESYTMMHDQSIIKIPRTCYLLQAWNCRRGALNFQKQVRKGKFVAFHALKANSQS